MIKSVENNHGSKTKITKITKITTTKNWVLSCILSLLWCGTFWFCRIINGTENGIEATGIPKLICIQTNYLLVACGADEFSVHKAK